MRVRSSEQDRFYELVGDRIRTERKASGIQKTQLAARSGITEASLDNAENGQACSLYILAKIAHELDTTLDALVPVDAIA